MNVGTTEIIEYYNNMLPYMKKYHEGVNIGRLNRINEALGKFVKTGMTVLDVGCGTGITSKYMADLGAKVIAVDIAPDLIEYAKEHSFHKNITYIAENIYFFISEQKFDLIVLADVLEHFPYEDVFRNINELIRCNTHDNTRIYLNIPDCNFLKYMRENHPEKLQIIDNGHSMKNIIGRFSCCGFEPIMINFYGLDVAFQYNEYLFLNSERLKKEYRRL